MPGKGCNSKRPHTPYTSKVQATAGNIARAVAEGKLPESALKGASKSMYKGMTKKELVSHSEEAKGKDLPKRMAKEYRGGIFPKKKR